MNSLLPTIYANLSAELLVTERCWYCPSLGLWNFKYNGVWILASVPSPTLTIGSYTMTTGWYLYGGKPYWTGGGWTVWFNGSKYVLSQYLGVQTYKLDTDNDGDEEEQVVSYTCATLTGTYTSNEETPKTVTATLALTAVGSKSGASRGGEYSGGSKRYYVGWALVKDAPKTTGYRSRYYYQLEDGTYKFWFYGTETLGKDIAEADTDPAGYTRTTLGYAADGDICDTTRVGVATGRAMPDHVATVYWADSNSFM